MESMSKVTHAEFFHDFQDLGHLQGREHGNFDLSCGPSRGNLCFTHDA